MDLLSLFFFADNLVLFAKATLENCEVIKKVLDMFCKVSGQTISGAKSRAFFSPNIDQDNKEALSIILGFQLMNCLGRYLGFPIKHRGGSNEDFNFILDKVKKKLAGWLEGELVVLGKEGSAHPNIFLSHTSLCHAM